MGDQTPALARTNDRTPHSVKLTGPQLRVLHETLSVVLADPEWGATSATSPRDMATLERAHGVIIAAWREACRSGSTPAGRLP